LPLASRTTIAPTVCGCGRHAESGTRRAGKRLDAERAFSPDGATLAAGGLDSMLWLWDAATGETRARLQGHSDYVRSVAFSPDGRTLASAGDDDTMRIWGIPASAALPTQEPTAVLTEMLTEAPTEFPTEFPTEVAAAPTSAPLPTPRALPNCQVSPVAAGARARSGPGTDFEVEAVLDAGVAYQVVGQAAGADGYGWWLLIDGAWVRSDVVNEIGECDRAVDLGGGSSAANSLTRNTGLDTGRTDLLMASRW